jgi:hypothetical protein
MRTKWIAIRWITVLSISAMSVFGWGQSQPKDRFALTVDQIAQTLSDNGFHVTGQQVSLLANVVAAEPHPLLDVLAVEPLGGRRPGESTDPRTLVRLACREPGKCLPFYVIVMWPKGLVSGELRAHGSPAAGENPVLGSNAAITMRAGTRATLVMDDDRSHIQVAVISLENGIVGHRIRVASPDHKQIYIGEVVSRSQLRRSY